MFLKNALFSLLIVTGFFAACELILAVAGVTPVLLNEDPFVGFSETIPQFVEGTGVDGSIVLKTANNKRGLFNYQEFPRDKDADTYRIFCMGGSTTYGRPYGDRVSFCGWLRAYLRAADTSRNWEVINAGGISFASYRVARLMNELSHYEPDLFIVYSGQNEFLEERSYAGLADLPDWLINLNVALSGTRTYTVMRDMIHAVRPASAGNIQGRYRLNGEVDEILNNTIGPESYHRNDVLKRQVIDHYRLNLVRMVRIARSVDADVILVRPAVNLKDMSPFKSEHGEGLGERELEAWEALYQRASALYADGDFSAALQTFQQALAIDDRHADLHFRIGRSYFESGQYDMAEQAFRRAVEEDIAPLRILSSMQKIVEEVAVSEDVAFIDFPGILREVYLRDHDHAVFGREYFPDHVHTNMEGYRFLGLALFDELVDQGIARPAVGWSEDRIDAVREAVVASIDPRAEGHTMLNLGKVFDWAGKFDEAYEALMRAYDILGPNLEIYDRLARNRYASGQYDSAIHYLNEMLVIAPDLPDIHSRLARVYADTGRMDDAIFHCQAELELDPDDHHTHAGLAKLYEAKGDTDAALRYYSHALQHEPDFEFAHVELASLLVRLGRYDEAQKHARAALQLNPRQFRAHTVLGLVRKNQGRNVQASKHFMDALQLEPGYTPARENLQQVQMVNSEDDDEGNS